MTSTIKVNNIQNQCGANIINESSNTITIGASGDTIALASGASQTGFGRTGTVDWQTGSIKTATFTAANGEGYFANTSGGAFTMNLPAGSAGNIVSVVDYTNTFQTYNLTISPNGSQKIGGVNANFISSTEGQSLTFVYVDDTEGWKNVQDSTSNATGDPFLVATGGTITTSGNYKIHTFTGPGTFTVSKISCTAAENIVSYLVVAGGGGGGEASSSGAGAGGGGGFREYKGPADCYTASPLNGNPGGTAVTVTATSFPITVGGGGTGGTSAGGGTRGGVSTFSTITSTGGGGGIQDSAGPNQPGGSGGGVAYATPSAGGTGNTPPVSPPQGQPAGTAATHPSNYTGSGGGGATGAGGNGGPGPAVGGVGATTNINGSPTAFSGGGGGGAAGPTASSGGAASPCGTGGAGKAKGAGTGDNGTTNRGGGGGSAGFPGPSGANGGSGIVIIRYKFQ
jgi:hypothetical protein